MITLGTAEERSQRIIKTANLNGYNREDTISAAIYWFASQQYLDHDFAKAWANNNWQSFLQKLVLVNGDIQRLDFIEEYETKN